MFIHKHFFIVLNTQVEAIKAKAIKKAFKSFRSYEVVSVSAIGCRLKIKKLSLSVSPMRHRVINMVLIRVQQCMLCTATRCRAFENLFSCAKLLCWLFNRGKYSANNWGWGTEDFSRGLNLIKDFINEQTFRFLKKIFQIFKNLLKNVFQIFFENNSMDPHSGILLLTYWILLTSLSIFKTVF